MILVIDSSAVLKWVLNETDSDAAQQMLDDYRAGLVDLIAPSLVHSEVGNVLAKLVRRGELISAQAKGSFDLVREHSPMLYDSPATWELALAIATLHRQSYYDCLFLALALDRRCDLITADERFFRGMHDAFSCLTLLRNYVPSGKQEH